MNNGDGTLQIRPSKFTDKDTLMKMVNEVYGSCEAHMWIANHERLTEERFNSYHKNQDEELFVAEICGIEIVGCVGMSNIEGDGKELSTLVVRPDCRGRGIGRQLVDHVVNKSRSDKCDYVQLLLLYPTHQPDPWKQTLRKWYNRLGFQFVKNDDFALYCPTTADLKQEVTLSIFKKSLKENTQ